MIGQNPLFWTNDALHWPGRLASHKFVRIRCNNENDLRRKPNQPAVSTQGDLGAFSLCTIIGSEIAGQVNPNTLLYFTLLSSASSGYTIGRLSLTQLFTSVVGIPISLYHLGTSSSQRCRGLPLGRRPSGWITSVLLWGAVGAILLTCDHNLVFFLFAVCSAGCMFTRRLISSFLILSILVFPAAFLRHLISVVVNICLSLLVSVQFSLWYSRVGVYTAFMILLDDGHLKIVTPLCKGISQCHESCWLDRIS